MHEVQTIRWIGVLIGLTLLAGCDASGTTEPPDGGPSDPASVVRGDVPFVQGYGQGYDRARQDGKPMMLFFTAQWCDYCHQMAGEAFVDSQVVSLCGQFVCVLVDADAEPDVCRQFGVRGYPTIQFMSPRGVPLNRLVGKQPAEQLALEMQAALRAVASWTPQTAFR